MSTNKLPLFTPIVKDLNKKTMTITIGMNKRSVSAVTNRTNEYKALPQKLKPAMEQIAGYVKDTMIHRTFLKEGPGWRQLAKRTIREREAKGYPGRHPILRRTGDLYAELTEKSHPHHIEIIKVGKRARIEIGASSTKFLENQLGKASQNLPPRAMIPGTGDIPILDRDRMEMSKIIEKAYQQYINKPR